MGPGTAVMNYYDQARKEDIFGRTKKPLGTVGRTPQRPVGGTGEGTGTLGDSLPGLAFGFAVCRRQHLSSQWLSASLAQKFCKGRAGKVSGLLWTHGMLWVCGQRLASGMYRGSMDRMASSFLPHQEGALRPHKGSGV